MAGERATGHSDPQPSLEQLRRQISEERDALAESLDKLTGEVGEASDAARAQAAVAARKARTVGSVVAGAVVVLVVARAIFRRRRNA